MTTRKRAADSPWVGDGWNDQQEDEESAAAAAASAEPVAKKQRVIDQTYFQLMRAGSSFSKYDEKLRERGFLPDKATATQQLKQDVFFDRKSKRMAAIFRLLRELSTVMVAAPSWEDNDFSVGTSSVKDLFRFVRCSVRYSESLMKEDEALDAQAMIADSEQDKIMIHCIEDCCLRVGYFILRALAAVREYGSPLAQGLGLYALICSNDTLQDFISLVNFMYIDSKIYLRIKHSA